jgi:hypothetical protein
MRPTEEQCAIVDSLAAFKCSVILIVIFGKREFKNKSRKLNIINPQSELYEIKIFSTI